MKGLSAVRWLWATAILAVFWIALFVLTHLPAGGAWDASLADLWQFPFHDKVLHFAGFAGLGALLCWNLGRVEPLSRHPWLRTAIALLALAIYAAADEWLQSFVPGRTPDLLDCLADMAGASCGTVFYWLVSSLAAYLNRNSSGSTS